MAPQSDADLISEFERLAIAIHDSHYHSPLSEAEAALDQHLARVLRRLIKTQSRRVLRRLHAYHSFRLAAQHRSSAETIRRVLRRLERLGYTDLEERAFVCMYVARWTVAVKASPRLAERQINGTLQRIRRLPRSDPRRQDLLEIVEAAAAQLYSTG
jgi:DNA-binding transcriptional regulator YhcF (GntR family)